MDISSSPDISYDATSQTLFCQGSWTVLKLSPEIETQIGSFRSKEVQHIDARNISQFDSAGAKIMLQIFAQHTSAKLQIRQEHERLLSLIQKYPQTNISCDADSLFSLGWLAKLGRYFYRGYQESLLYLSFLGECVCLACSWCVYPQKILWKNIARVLETAGFFGMPIIGLLSFLIGVVLAYQMGVQLESYGANIFVVNLLGIAILREFAPLITAIIVAGRTGSAYTAELGMMKVDQELDALTTMGVKPLEYLVLPKIIGLVIAFPLLSMWAAFTGLFGGMLMSKMMLGISFHNFWIQFQQAIAIKQLWIGLMKTPFFAFIIASIGCFQGLKVSGGAENVGLQTTRSVVQSLFMIIVADAFFSILLSFFHA